MAAGATADCILELPKVPATVASNMKASYGKTLLLVLMCLGLFGCSKPEEPTTGEQKEPAKASAAEEQKAPAKASAKEPVNLSASLYDEAVDLSEEGKYREAAEKVGRGSTWGGKAEYPPAVQAWFDKDSLLYLNLYSKLRTIILLELQENDYRIPVDKDLVRLAEYIEFLIDSIDLDSIESSLKDIIDSMNSVSQRGHGVEPEPEHIEYPIDSIDLDIIESSIELEQF